MFFLGSVFGTLIFGYISDRFGRMKGLVISNYIMMISGLVTPYCRNFTSFCLIRFVMGTSYDTFVMNAMMLSLELTSIEKRSWIGNLSLAIGMTLGGGYNAFFIRYLGDWRIHNLATYGQTLYIMILPL